MASTYPVKRYQLFRQVRYETTLRGYEYSDEYFSINRNGVVFIGNGICSDGCSPTYDLPIFGMVGPWDGAIEANGLPETWRAFFLHDALMERRKNLGIPVARVHDQFELEIKRSGFIFASLYAWMVHKFGPKT